ncbi:hypothetical protein [Endozoicomonas euniceicola]|uniref:Uncharacterized protein n=1 Tax=Endozoicomonas euniceicola TaxID=1234143 RepID=A0ABY6GY54_9GAMM|nr:hypothetical protein [Endozoicomonas euniceicola]UYM17507.1 hypothetical protein NX720_06210 [Endozoicomonas euniceicola]
MENLPPKMNGAYFSARQMPMYPKLLHNDHDDVDRPVNESKPEKHTDDFDDDLDFYFGTDPEEETASPLRKNSSEDENGYKVVELEWNEILKKYVAVLTNLLPVILKTYNKTPVNDSLNFETDPEFTEPDVKSIYVSLPVRSSSENSYPVKRTGESDDEESSDSPSNSKEPDNDDSEDIIPSKQPRVSSHSEYHLKTVPIKSDDNDRHFLRIGPSDCLNSCNLTEQGAKELQADNPELFATTEDARAAFQALTEHDFKETTHTVEYQAIARLISKYQDKPVAELMKKYPEKFQTMKMKDAWRAIDNYNSTIEEIWSGGQMPSKERDEVLEEFISDQKQNPVNQQILSSTAYTLDVVFAYSIDDSIEFFTYVAPTLFIHLDPQKADNTELLIICNRNYEGMEMYRLTKWGALKLHEINPDLFPTADFASSVFCVLFGRECPNVYDVDTLQYQAIAELVDEYISKGSIENIIVEEDFWHIELYIERIPYKMFSNNYFAFDKDKDKDSKAFSVSKSSWEKYNQHCQGGN